MGTVASTINSGPRKIVGILGTGLGGARRNEELRY